MKKTVANYKIGDRVFHTKGYGFGIIKTIDRYGIIGVLFDNKDINGIREFRNDSFKIGILTKDQKIVNKTRKKAEPDNKIMNSKNIPTPIKTETTQEIIHLPEAIYIFNKENKQGMCSCPGSVKKKTKGVRIQITSNVI